MGDRELDSDPGGRRVASPAIVHFEITIESLRGQAAASSERFDIAILNARTGDVVIDSRLKQRSGKPRPAHAPEWRPPATLPYRWADPGDNRFHVLAEYAGRGRNAGGR